MRELDSADLGLGWDMCGTDRNPAGMILGGRSACDNPLRDKMDEAPTVIIPGDGRLGRQNSELAVRAEHFGSGATWCFHCHSTIRFFRHFAPHTSHVTPQTFA